MPHNRKGADRTGASRRVTLRVVEIHKRCIGARSHGARRENAGDRDISHVLDVGSEPATQRAGVDPRAQGDHLIRIQRSLPLQNIAGVRKRLLCVVNPRPRDVVYGGRDLPRCASVAGVCSAGSHECASFSHPRDPGAGIATFLAATFTARAQTWDGGGTNDNFNTANNWNPNAVPANTGTADLIFSGNVRPTPVVNINFAVDSVTFDAAASAFNIGASGGSILTVGAGGIANNSVNTQTFSAPVTFSTSSSITAGALVDFTGAVNLGVSAVTVNANANVDFNVVSGTGGLVKNGTGALNLASSGTQDYDITVNNGIVDLDRP